MSLTPFLCNTFSVQGQLNGSVRTADVQNIIVPSIAGLLNQIVAGGGSEGAMVLNLFDTGCNGVEANDGVIALCEVSNNSLFNPLLAADVDIYAEDGSYAPNSANTGKDSLSFSMLQRRECAGAGRSDLRRFI